MNAVLYIHGKGGSSSESVRYEALFPGRDVIGLEYEASTPWNTGAQIGSAVEELKSRYEKITLIANSIGAFFSMNANIDALIEKAYFISPIVDMEGLIVEMMAAAGVGEDELRSRGTVETPFGVTLSWEYLEYVRRHPIEWSVPTAILYADGDALTARRTVEAFAKAHGASLTVMENGEHWFHTGDQLRFLDNWIKTEENTIGTERMILRPWRESDADDLFKYASDPDVGPAGGWRAHTSGEESRRIIRDLLSAAEIYAIVLKETGETVGSVGLKFGEATDMTDEKDEAELGYWIAKPYWGQGLMTEAANALLRRAFGDVGLSKVWCGYYDGNVRSKRVQEKCGFVYHHTTEDLDVPQLNEKRTGHANCLTREQWEKRFSTERMSSK